MSEGSSASVDVSQLEEGEIRSPGTADIANTLLEMNANEGGNGDIGNRNHEPVTDGAEGAGQGDVGSSQSSQSQAQGTGVAVSPAETGNRSLSSASQSANIGSTSSMGVSQDRSQGTGLTQGTGLNRGRGQGSAGMQGPYFPMMYGNPMVYGHLPMYGNQARSMPPPLCPGEGESQDEAHPDGVSRGHSRGPPDSGRPLMYRSGS